jgi:site-specific DNA-methyltransferase (adenine-specific)/site-specific DNA-methyltransferase (cytosine-N4-specific)
MKHALPQPFPRNPGSEIQVGDAQLVLKSLSAERFQACITSPPYWGLRDYAETSQLGAEDDVMEYVEKLVAVFREVRRLLRPDGTLWLNLGDSFTSGGRTWRAPDRKNAGRAMGYRPPTPSGLKPKDLIGVPWRVAFALQADGWYLRSDIIWHKPNCQPESVKDRPVRAHEYLFLLSRSEKYYYDHESIREPRDHGPGRRSRRSVWSINTTPNPEAHFACFPPELVEPCLLASTRPGDTILDPFFGTGTVGAVAQSLGRVFLGVELKEQYAALARARLGLDE